MSNLGLLSLIAARIILKFNSTLNRIGAMLQPLLPPLEPGPGPRVPPPYPAKAGTNVSQAASASRPGTSGSGIPPAFASQYNS
jgi:hypothetical protein